MSIKLPAYLHRNRHGVFGFRVVIPKSLPVSFPAQEYRLSVGTSNKKHAKRIALRMAGFTQDYFHKVRRMSTNGNDLPGFSFAADLELERDRFVKELDSLADSTLEHDDAHDAIRDEFTALRAARGELDLLAEQAQATNDAALAQDLADGPSQKITIRIPRPILDLLRTQAVLRGLPYQTYINRLLYEGATR